MHKRKKEAVPGSSDQKMTWKAAVKFDSFEGADTYRNEYEAPSGCRVKIKRRKDCFEVRLGTPIKKKEA